ncbi:NUDIX domain-containing protein [Streptomyces kaniharaensis]|nr:NUDIX domain-containing protein [Streptomyces kaniharaensis]
MSERARFSAAAAAYIAQPDGRVLLVHHAKADRWVLPGGKAEHNEPPLTTCRREAEEEIGVPVRVGRLLTFNWLTPAAALWPEAVDIDYAYPCHMLTFHATIDPADVERIKLPARELLAYRWWDVDEAAASGVMEQYNARNLLAATQVHRGERPAAYLEA